MNDLLATIRRYIEERMAAKETESSEKKKVLVAEEPTEDEPEDAEDNEE